MSGEPFDLHELGRKKFLLRGLLQMTSKPPAILHQINKLHQEIRHMEVLRERWPRRLDNDGLTTYEEIIKLVGTGDTEDDV